MVTEDSVIGKGLVYHALARPATVYPVWTKNQATSSQQLSSAEGAVNFINNLPRRRPRLESEPTARSTSTPEDGRSCSSGGYDAPLSHITSQPRLIRSQSSMQASETDCEEAQSAMGITRKVTMPQVLSLQTIAMPYDYSRLTFLQILNLNSDVVGERSLSAIPDGEINDDAHVKSGSRSARSPISCILGCALPSKEITDILLEEYFDSVHWFSLVILEPIFRPQYESIADGYAYSSQKGFLFLLATVLGLAAWYRSKRCEVDDASGEQFWADWKSKLLSHVETGLLDLLDRRCLTSIQTCLLLGSYYIYHGRPNASFALLGASIKTAQAMRLHRVSSGEFHAVEERKRVWWTVYTWDRCSTPSNVPI